MDLLRYFTSEKGHDWVRVSQDAGAASFALDLFDLRQEGGSVVRCAVVANEQWDLWLLDARDRDGMPESVRGAINAHEVSRTPRCLEASQVHLFALGGFQATADRPGLNDPVLLKGKLCSGWPLDASESIEGHLTVSRGALLQAFVDAAPHAFSVFSASPAENRTCQCCHLLLAGEGVEETREGRGLVLAYPVNPLSRSLLDSGNEFPTQNLLLGVLREFCRDLEKHHPEPALRLKTLPVPNRGLLLRELEREGYTIEGPRASKPRKGWLGRLFPMKIDIPEEGSLPLYLRLAREALGNMMEWPSELAMAVQDRIDVKRVGWYHGTPMGIWPVAWAESPVREENLSLVSPAPRLGFRVLDPRTEKRRNARWRCMYFDVDDAFARHNQVPLRLSVELKDTGPGQVSGAYDSGSAPYDDQDVEPFNLTGSGAWVQAVFDLPRPCFRNRQVMGADFRLNILCANDVPVRSVSLARKEEICVSWRKPPEPRIKRVTPGERREPEHSVEKSRKERARRGPSPLTTREEIVIDFNKADWKRPNQCTVEVEDGRLFMKMTGNDPHVYGPSIMVPGPALATLRMRSNASGLGMILFITKQHSRWNEGQRFDVIHDNQWHEYQMPLCELDVIDEIRLDPAEGPGEAEIEHIRIIHKPFPPYQGMVSDAPHVVYFDPRYGHTWLGGGARLAEYCEAKHEMDVLDADHLRAWMLRHIERYTAPRTLCVMAHDVAPFTVFESRWKHSTIRRYMEAGGRVAMAGHLPFAERAFSGGQVVHAGGHHGGGHPHADCVLGFWGDPAGWDVGLAPELTEDGKAWGKKLIEEDRSFHGVNQADVTVTFSRLGQYYAATWFKNYNPAYSMSGLVRYRNHHLEPHKEENFEDFLRVALHGME